MTRHSASPILASRTTSQLIPLHLYMALLNLKLNKPKPEFITFPSQSSFPSDSLISVTTHNLVRNLPLKAGQTFP